MGQNDISDAELKMSGYLMYRKDKAADNRVKGGGVLLYVKEGFVPLSYSSHVVVSSKTQSGVR